MTHCVLAGQERHRRLAFRCFQETLLRITLLKIKRVIVVTLVLVLVIRDEGAFTVAPITVVIRGTLSGIAGGNVIAEQRQILHVPWLLIVVVI
jgi:hypothetical protein